mmetsp:Transcript_11543/g.20494  ORF Transcript_11543/g.20494 Transcript_11543/m.20494 type:complete len:152 (+) Transcript_11543:78-533(+)|eukprot:CAMPEP_0119103094 /NCGR_PEP_ID=MMETSP1180-20130426/1636_1 /TAXON_ID=3052 ORGANISM="Chlamydomonas cf sp, Strain CCMP681" /NCGR_SAMPLE_ID=MMETSP1180 /ASSEMBLY_ACC=CAM_ASM_000741 /LENGTH=151 /DNA_ID=CAMNT_0007087529 /DNA_START=78 /DNA_END=533 /DNA_ORIENTATION=+
MVLSIRSAALGITSVRPSRVLQRTPVHVQPITARRTIVARAETTDTANDSSAELQKQASDVWKTIQTKWEETSDSEKPAAIAIIVASIVAQIIIGASVTAVDRIPLVSPFLEFIGIAFTANFIYRYTTDPEARIQVKESINSFVEAVTGPK